MDPNTGRIHDYSTLTLDGEQVKVKSAEKIARALGHVPIPAGELEAIRKLSTHERIAWAERKEARRRQRNARKKQRRAQRR